MSPSKTKQSPSGKKSKRTAPYGSWKSEITADMIAKGGVSFKDMVTYKDDIYWVESRPEEDGRYVVMHYSAIDKNEPEEYIPAGFSARTIIYSYGGGALSVLDKTAYFSNYNPATYPETCDQRIFKQAPGKRPEPITSEVYMSYGDAVVDENRKRLICVKEDHTSPVDGYPRVSIVGIDMAGEKLPEELVPGRNPNRDQAEQDADNQKGMGFDFYSSLSLNRDGSKLAYLAWNFPHMPWDSVELWVADINSQGLPVNHKRIAGDTAKLEPGKPVGQTPAGSKEQPPVDWRQPQSLFQPQWSPDGEYLYFVSDVDNWWHIYRVNVEEIEKKEIKIEKVTRNAPAKSEFGYPQWYLGMSTYTVFKEDEDKDEIKIAAAYNKEGEWHLAIIDPEETEKEKNFKTVEVNLSGGAVATEISYLRATGVGHIVFVAGCYNHPTSLVTCDPKAILKDKKQRYIQVEVLHESMKRDVFETIKEYLAEPVSIEYPTGTYMKDQSFAFYYYPKNPKYEGPVPEYEDEKKKQPPLLLLAHGGPTAAADTALNLKIQYFTSRGIAAADVNYRGSTGFGREYRLSLYLNWGVYDRDDCVNCAKYLSTEEAAKKIAEKNEDDPPKIKAIDLDRVLTRGGSAGGYLTLVLATFTSICKAGASYYGVSDLITLTKDTHKFEAHYLDEVTGPYPEERKKYMRRSPIYGLDLLDTALIFFQGDEDPVVPPEQSQRMFEAVKEKGVPTAYREYKGEQHGFRIAKNVKDSLESEFYFYSQILDFKPADDLEPIEIFNWTKK